MVMQMTNVYAYTWNNKKNAITDAKSSVGD